MSGGVKNKDITLISKLALDKHINCREKLTCGSFENIGSSNFEVVMAKGYGWVKNWEFCLKKYEVLTLKICSKKGLDL